MSNNTTLSKVYRGYVISQQDNGQWLILNAPTFANSCGFNPGPHNGWTVATHQVDKLMDYMRRGTDVDRGKYVRPVKQESESKPHSNNSDDEIPFTWSQANYAFWQILGEFIGGLIGFILLFGAFAVLGMIF